MRSSKGQRVVVVDDLLATGGTMAAGIALLRKVGAVVPAAAALIELTFLNGRSRLDVPCEALVSYRRMTEPPGRRFDTRRVRGRKVSWGDLG